MCWLDQAQKQPHGVPSAAKDVLAAAVKREFSRLLAEGILTPTQAAAMALKNVTKTS